MSNISLTKPLVIAVLLTLVGCSGEDASNKVNSDKENSNKVSANPSTAAARSVNAQTTLLEVSEQQATTATTGSVIAVESVRVASRLMGYLRNISVAEGDAVKQGQVLFTIDPLDIEGAVEQARLGLRQAEAAMQDAKADFDRFDNLYKDDVVSRQQFEKMKLNYDIAVSRAAQAKAGLGTAQGQMRYASVTAPINGVVTQKLAHEGDIAAPGHPVLMLENPAHLQVQTSVAESLFKSIRLGQEMRVEIDGHAQALIGRVAQLSPSADPMTHTYKVKLDVSAPGLKSGSFARVLFPSGQRTVLALPQSAILNRAGITGAFVVNAEGIAQYRMVRTGQSVDNTVEILSGLNPGERVITGNAQAVNNGDKINDTMISE